MPKITTLLPLLFCAVILSGLPQTSIASVLHPSHQSKNIPLTDTLNVDTLHSSADTTTVTPTDTSSAQPSAPDSLGRVRIPSFVGALDRHVKPDGIATAEDIKWADYRYIGDIIGLFSGVYIRTQQSEGQYDQLNIRGQDWRSVAILSNGRLVNDPASGIYNLYQFSTEFADRVELVTGPRAFIYGLNSTGGTLNFVTKNYNSNRPFTKINYSESAYDYTRSDGTFSQNVSRKVNITFGFQNQGTTGRFTNSTHDAWNLRAKIRYSITPDLNLILSEYHTSSQTDLNGGIGTAIVFTSLAFDPLQATVRNTDAYEKIRRNDVDLSLVGTFLGDTINVSTLTLYYSNNARQYRDEENRSTPNGVFLQSDHTSSWMGAHFTQNIDLPFQRFSVGGNIEIRQVEGSPNLGRRRNVIGSVWGKEEIVLSDILVVAGFGRYDRYLNRDYFGIGGDGTLNLTGVLQFFGGLSLSRRVPTYTELYWDGAGVTRFPGIAPENHRVAELGGRLRLLPWFELRVAYFHRTVEDAIRIARDGESGVFPSLRFETVDRIATNGVEFGLKASAGVFHLEGTGTLLTQISQGVTLKDIPKLTTRGTLFYRNTLLDDKLDLKIGVKGSYLSSQTGSAFNAEVLMYVPARSQTFSQGSSVDAFLIGHLGDAYIHLVWENLSNARYYPTPYYPVRDRVVRFGISWEFLN